MNIVQYLICVIILYDGHLKIKCNHFCVEIDFMQLCHNCCHLSLSCTEHEIFLKYALK